MARAPLELPQRELHFSFARSSGPGGQNVNKVESKVVLRWDVTRSRALPPDLLERFRARFARRITESGELVLASQRFRARARNLADCKEKLAAMLAEVATAPRKRRATRPGRSARERRLAEKRAVGRRKAERRLRED